MVPASKLGEAGASPKHTLRVSNDAKRATRRAVHGHCARPSQVEERGGGADALDACEARRKGGRGGHRGDDTSRGAREELHVGAGSPGALRADHAATTDLCPEVGTGRDVRDGRIDRRHSTGHANTATKGADNVGARQTVGHKAVLDGKERTKVNGRRRLHEDELTTIGAHADVTHAERGSRRFRRQGGGHGVVDRRVNTFLIGDAKNGRRSHSAHHCSS